LTPSPSTSISTMVGISDLRIRLRRYIFFES
jgi:hypothetical protein